MRILSLNGGGVFGAHSAVILNRLELACPGFIERTDVIAGTSIGGMLALMLSNGSTTQQCVDLCNNAASFFSTDVFRDAESVVGDKAYYSSDGRLGVLKGVLGDVILGDLKKYVVVQSFQVNDQPVWNSKVFHNIPGGSQIPDTCDVSAVDAGMATAAAPIYFPSWGNFVDGGVVANDPSMTALTLVQDSSFSWEHVGTALNQVKLFNVGRVYPGDLVSRQNWDAGWAKWITIIIEMLLTGNQGLVQYQCRQFLGNNYFTHCPELPQSLNYNIDDYEHVPNLVSWAESLDLTSEINWIKQNYGI